MTPRTGFRAGRGRWAASASPARNNPAVEIPGVPATARNLRLAQNVTLAKASPVVSAIAKVAEDVNPLAVDNGQTAWNPETATVLWVSSDSTTNDQIAEAEAAFLAIDGVDAFDYEAEAMPAGWCDATVVYGGQPFDCEAVTASAAPAPAAAVQATYEMTLGSPAGRYFTEATIAAGFSEHAGDSWPTEAAALTEQPGLVFRDGDKEAVYQLADGTLVHVGIQFGWFRVHIAAAAREGMHEVFQAFRGRYPAAYLQQDGEATKVPITFWMLGPHGPESILRRVGAATWDDVQGNYTAPVRAELERIMEWQNGPDVDGKLMLWHGAPGTGKTWALRVLASAWSSWAEFNFITDSDAFFVKDASYMVKVLLAESYDVIDEPSGDVYTEQDDGGKWRVLIFEDTGQLLAADASDTYRQGLGRFLNVVDGMIGQGLKVLAVVTTNDELSALHPAVVRPGRCASQIEFGPLTPEEAAKWTGEEDAAGGTLAELYARAGRQTAEPLPAVPATPVEASGASEHPDLTEAEVEAEVEALAALARSPLPPDPQPDE